jgi:hypothetical protein
MSAGKGDTPRPLSVPSTTFADRWAQTFGGPVAKTGTPSDIAPYAVTENRTPEGSAQGPKP